MRRAHLAVGALGIASVLAVPALAVTFGPLDKSGITTSERKGFYLHLANPYQRAHEFRVFVPPESAQLSDRTTILPERMTLAGGARKRILVIAREMDPGERREFRICAERIPIEKETVHARVCSRLTARRVDR